MRFGYHASISGGLVNTVNLAKKEKLGSIQIFPGSPKSYFPSKHTSENIQLFKNLNIPKFVHSNYFLNISSDNPVTPKSLYENLVFCDSVGASGLVVHMGSNPDKALGMKNILDNIVKMSEYGKTNTPILIETTAEGGNRLKFSDIVSFVEDHRDLNVYMCLDSEHMYAAGYSCNDIIAIVEKYKDIIKCFHLNNPNPEVEFGGHLDRHTISLFDTTGKFTKLEIENMIQMLKLYQIPAILETGAESEDCKLILEKYV